MSIQARQRRAKDHEATEKRRRRTVVIFSLFMIFLMVFSVASVINYGPDSSNQMVYGDYEFTLESRAGGGSVLVATMDGREVEFQNLPVQVQHLPVDPLAVSLLRNSQQVALSADPLLEPQTAGLVDYARLQLGVAIPKSFNVMSQSDPRYVLPVLACEQGTPQVPVVHFNVTNETAAVTASGGCITLHGNNQDMMRLKDRLIFEYYGILQDGQVVED